jgi:hypothetical protein
MDEDYASCLGKDADKQDHSDGPFQAQRVLQHQQEHALFQ